MVARGGGEGGGGEGGCAREAGRVWRTRRTKPYSHSILYRTPSVRPYGITRIITQNHKIRCRLQDRGCRQDAGRMCTEPRGCRRAGRGGAPWVRRAQPLAPRSPRGRSLYLCIPMRRVGQSPCR